MSVMMLEKSTGVQVPAEADADGNLNVNIAAGSVTATVDTGMTADMDSGAGTQTGDLIGIAVAASGGAVAVTGDATNGLDVDVTRVIPGTTATALGKAEDAAHTTADTGVAVLAVRRDTAAVGSDTDGDYSTLNVNASGRLYTSATVDAALPAGTNNIGDVDVLSVVPGTAATSLGKAEDAAHTTADTGVAVLAVRRDTAAVGSDTDGDYSTLNVNASGRLYTSATVDAALPAGTNNIGDVDVLSVVPGTGATALGKAEDAAHTSADTGVALLAVRRDTAAVGSDTDGDYSTVNVDAAGHVWTRLPVPGTATHSNVVGAASDTQILAAAATRKTFMVFNDSSAVLYLKFGTGASSSSHAFQIQPGELYSDESRWTGVVNGIWASATGNARVTEFT